MIRVCTCNTWITHACTPSDHCMPLCLLTCNENQLRFNEIKLLMKQ